MEPVRVVLADRSRLVRGVLRRALQEEATHVVGEAASGASLVELCRAEAPHVAVVDCQLADGPIDAFLPAVRETGTRVVVLTADRSPERLTTLLLQGVVGYLLRDAAPAHVAECVRSVAEGGAVLDPTATWTVLEQWRRMRIDPGTVAQQRAVLTARENAVLRAMADGLATKAIARRLGVAVKTVENHKIRVFDKLGVRTQAHAVSVAIGHGLLVPDLEPSAP